MQARMEALFADVAAVPGVTAVISPYAPPARGRSPRRRHRLRDRAVRPAWRRRSRLHDRHASARSPTPPRQGASRSRSAGGCSGSTAALGPAELIGILAAIVILLVVFGSVLAMGLPIIIALFGIGIGLGFVELLSHVIATPDFATQLASMIGIGVGIDYALFIVTRYRQGLRRGLEPERAVVPAIDTAGRAVLFAGCTVVISLLGLFLMGVEFVNGMAVGTSVTVAVVMLASITLLPAVLGFAGRNIDRFSVASHGAARRRAEQSMWFRWSRVVQRRPWPAFARRPRRSWSCSRSRCSRCASASPTPAATRRPTPPAGPTTWWPRASAPGFNGPLDPGRRVPRGRRHRGPLDALVADAPRHARRRRGRRRRSLSPRRRRRHPGDPGRPRRSRHRPPTWCTPARRRDPAAVARHRRAGARRRHDRVEHRRVRPPVGRLPFFIGAVLVLSFLLLLVVFRSLLVPLKAVMMNLLSIGAAYGIVVAVFQWGWLGGVIGIGKTGPIAPFVPMMMFAILFGLSMDYEVFLLSRIREEYDRTHDNALAVADGLASTARVITAAALDHGDGLRQLRRSATRRRSSCSASASPPRSSSTPPSCAWCWCRRPWSCSATATGGSRAGSTASCPACTWRPVGHRRRARPPGREEEAELQRSPSCQASPVGSPAAAPARPRS